MLKDITIGQYFPGNSVVHRLDARYKIIITSIYIVMLFLASQVWILGIGTVFLILALILSRLSIKMFMKSLKPILPILIVTSIINLFFIDGEPLVEFWIFKITEEGFNASVFMVVRIILLIIGSSILTYTTSPITLTDAIERLLSPLKKIKLPVHELAMMMTIALRFIPTLIDETDKIMSAQKARGADLETGSIFQRAKAFIPILIPLFVSSFRRAEELALAMECRCYRGGEGRTRLRIMHSNARDYIALAITLIFLAGTIAMNTMMNNLT